MDFFLDSAEPKEISKFYSLGVINGVTTNPSLIYQSNKPFKEIISQICEITKGPVSVEAVSNSYEEMVAEGLQLAKMASNVVVKLPITWDGVRACKKLSENKIIDEVAEALSDEKAVGWMQGRMEFGPRALGGRSIIADPRSPIMQKQLNLKVKYRESFRPFAPSILREDVSKWFEHYTDSPYMLNVAKVSEDKRLAMTEEEEALFGIDKLNVPRSSVPAITHVDYSARIQTVHEDTNSRYHALILKFKEKTGCPIVVNTSFNVRGEPIICTPTDAFKCFMGTDLDVLAVGNYLLIKKEQNKNLLNNYKDLYDLD